ncbi:MAG: acyl-ACP--UDP-N-acetylglucosamine O-acyltransferase [Candidatus Eremiobacteraeota bacterium]|nr:acyl-ACP--UDP-N-acetylglucosamine O-acyltransferase [Candidatus Eremiobacteraeota bacterium]
MIHPSAVVHPRAEIGEGAEIGPFCVIGEGVRIGARTRLLAHVVVNGYTTIGEDSEIHPFCSIGAPSQDRKYHGERSFTTIGSRTILREYVSVHRATGAEEITSVGDDSLLLAYVHVAHNCRIGNHVVMSSTAQLAGHVHIADFATIGGQTGVHQFVRIGEHAMVGGITKLTRDVPPYFLIEGNPAQPYGLNMVGLRRAEFTPEIVSELKECYKILYRSGLNISQAAEAMRDIVASDHGRALLAFIDTRSERGITK